MRTSKVFRIPMSHPGDVSGLKALFDKGTIAPNEVVAILGKTEGNGCVNDFTRGYSTFAFQVLLAETLKISREEVAKHVAFVMSGGTEGVLSPHANVFVRSQSSSSKQAKSKRLSI
ncbi:MAG: cyanuric acid amidohydrolase, partial [Alphaproteobacteria bacterium]|nr:cyanuric acid amidohydrolase [Alphaproteobacteria bacterium]